MNENNLFDRARIVLASTIIAPLLVAGYGVVNADFAPKAQVNSYVANTSASKDQKAEDEKADETKQDNQKDEAAEQPAPKDQTVADAKTEGSYTVKEGDTYGCIAENYYGSYDQWSKVYAQNAGWPGFNEYDLAVGANLVMPAVSSDQVLPKTDLCN